MRDLLLDSLANVGLGIGVLGIAGLLWAVSIALAARARAWSPGRVEYDEDSAAEHDARLETVCVDCGCHVSGPVTPAGMVKSHGLCARHARERLAALRPGQSADGWRCGVCGEDFTARTGWFFIDRLRGASERHRVRICPNCHTRGKAAEWAASDPLHRQV